MSLPRGPVTQDAQPNGTCTAWELGADADCCISYSSDPGPGQTPRRWGRLPGNSPGVLQGQGSAPKAGVGVRAGDSLEGGPGNPTSHDARGIRVLAGQQDTEGQ